MTSAQVVETSVNVTSNSPSQDYTHPDDHNLPNYDMTPGFKPFTDPSFVSQMPVGLLLVKLVGLSTVCLPCYCRQSIVCKVRVAVSNGSVVFVLS